ncbi:Hypothetical predicted protein [Lecanosticta acicola]|uniref:Uncharacterized protein n=1 Tax=Lecanosticta acicola TaxID=111012 RepID=A0AAI9EAW0_9PEZI|nr:Hypothetical predicted protein [Lecanosticta acicola]
MPSYSFEVAKAVLNDTDKNRILCIYLSSNQTAINWQKATNDFGSASVESFIKMNVKMLKKIENAGGLESGENMAPPPAKAKKSRGKLSKDCSDSDADESPPEKPRRKAARRSCVVPYETPESDNTDDMLIAEGAVSEGEVDVVELL